MTRSLPYTDRWNRLCTNATIPGQVSSREARGAGTAPRFAADAALGRLAKWLRLAGFDTIYDPGLSLDTAKIHIASGRTLLTRTYSIYRAFNEGSAIHIRSDHYLEQIKEVIRAAGLEAGHLKPFSRCTRCNVPTVTVPKADVAGKVPDYVWQNTDTFRICNGCRHIYWRGSHTKKVLTVLACF